MWIPGLWCEKFWQKLNCASEAAVRQNPGRFPSLARRAAALTSMCRCVRDTSGASGVSIWDEWVGDGWVESSGIAPLYRCFWVVLASLLASSVGSIFWYWMKSTLTEKTYSISVLTVSWICLSLRICDLSSWRLSNSVGEFFLNRINPFQFWLFTSCPLPWHHCCGWQKFRILHQDRLLVVTSLKFIFHPRWPLV